MVDINKLCQNLQKKGFTMSFFENRSDAADYLCREIADTSVGFGGSKTLDELGLFERLAERNKVSWHWKQPPMEAYSNAAGSEVYLSSVNGISETGEIVNIDAVGNRLAGTLYGHKKVYFVVGTNKIEPTLEKAIWRARNIAAPLNAKRHEFPTPCAKSPEPQCFDCNSPRRICRGLLVLLQKPYGVGECEVVLIDEPLGY